MAKPLWYKLFAQGDYPLFDRLQAFFSANPNYAEDRGVARLLSQLTNPAARAETPLQTDPAISFTLLPRTSETSGRPYIVPTPEVDALHDVDSAEAKAGAEPGPTGVAEAGDLPTISVLVDWPWLLAFGLMPISQNSGLEAKREPRGWVENYLDQSAQASPLLAAFGAEGFNDLAADSSFLAWAGTPLGQIELSGDFSAGFTLSALYFDIDRLTAAAGSDYNLASDDDFVAAGDVLMIDATALGEDDGMMFDGAAETDGSFVFLGGEANDYFFGGAGNDRITGGGGADAMAGGGGSDIFIYGDAGESSGTNYDTISGFDPSADRIDLPGSVSGFGAAIEGGALSTASFNDDLSAVLGGLAPSQAVWFAPDSGDLAGQIFLIVDGNGQAGYQEGEDFVIAVEGAPLADLSGHTDIFI